MDKQARKLRTQTATILLVCLSVWLFWDIYVATNDVQDDTISELTRDLSHYLYVVPWALGGIMGHFFWNKRDKEEGRPVRFKAWLATCGIVFVASPLIPNLHYMNTVFFVVGFPVGAWLWPQGPRSV